MRVWRCKCGETETFGSMPPRQCQVCQKCGGTMLRGLDGNYRQAIPHDVVVETTRQEHGGNVSEKKRTYCARCFETLDSEEVKP